MSQLEFNAICDCGEELEYFEAEPELGYLFESWECQSCDKSYIKSELYSY